MTSKDLAKYIVDFFQKASKDNNIELYNEFSLQHELGIYLRNLHQFANYKVQFERNAEDFFGITGTVKKEIDIVVYNDKEKFAIELKFPRNGAYPRSMFQFIEDICFVEQLKNKGFDGGCAVVLVDDPNFYSAKGLKTGGIYTYFRGVKPTPIQGSVKNNKQLSLVIQNKRQVVWVDTKILDSKLANTKPKYEPAKYYIIEI
jgi:hypothetical protein